MRTRLTDEAFEILLDRPRRKNALTNEMIRGLPELFDAASSDPGVRVVVLRGAGGAFCSGADFTEGVDAALAGRPTIQSRDVERLVGSIARCAKPVVAVLDGPVAGLGVALALASHVVIAAESASFMIAFSRLGLMPEGNASLLLAASTGRMRALRMTLLAEPLSAYEAERAGLVTYVVAKTHLDETLERVLSTLRASSADGLRASIEAVDLVTLAPWRAAADHEARTIPQLVNSPAFRSRLHGVLGASRGDRDE